MTDLPNRPYLKIKEVACYFGVCAKTIDRWSRKGDLMAIKVNGSTRINRDSVIRLEVEGLNKRAFPELEM